MSFDIRDHLDNLEPDGGSHCRDEASFYCPVCHAKNFKVEHKTGKYSTFSCDCASTELGKKKIRGAIAPRDWQKPTRQQQKRTWTYTDFDGEPSIQVHRTDDGNGKRRIWQKSLVSGKQPKDLEQRTAPYRYCDCLKVLEKDVGYVFWVEGEACADALWDLGIPATTTLRGSNGYHSEIHKGLFPPEKLVICPDRDQPGLKYADQIAADYPEAQWLYPFPDSPLWERPQPSGGADIADWIADGATAETIKAGIGSCRALAVASYSGSEPTTPVLMSGQQQEQVTLTLKQVSLELQTLVSEGISETVIQQRIPEFAQQAQQPLQAIKDLYRAIKQDLEKSEQDHIAAQAVKAKLPDAIVARNAKLPILEALQGDGGQFASEVLAVAQAMPIAVEYLITALIPVLATSIGTSSRLIVNYAAGWVEKLIFWALLIRKTGELKTPVLNVAKSGLELLEDLAYEEYKLALQQYEQDGERFNALPPNEKQEASPPVKPNRQRFILRDDTLQARTLVHVENPRGLLRFRDEGSAFLTELGRFKHGRGDGGETEADLSEFNGSELAPDRVTNRVECRLSRTALQRLGATQPEVLKSMMGDHCDARGRWARYLFCLVDSPPAYLDFSRPDSPSQLTNTLVDLHQRLGKLPEQDYLLGDEAKPVFQDAYNHYRSIVYDNNERDPGSAAAAAKMGTYLSRLTLWLHLVNAALANTEPSPTITAETVAMAAQWTAFYWQQNQLLMARNAPENEITGDLLKVWTYIEKHQLVDFLPSDISANVKFKDQGKTRKEGKLRYKPSKYHVELLTRLVALGYLTQSGKRFSKKPKDPENSQPKSEGFQGLTLLDEKGIQGTECRNLENLNGSHFPGNGSNGHGFETKIVPLSQEELHIFLNKDGSS